MSFYFSFSNFEPLIYDENFFFLMQKPNWITYPIPAGSESYTSKNTTKLCYLIVI